MAAPAANATSRKRNAKGSALRMVAPEPARSTGTIVLLPAGAPEAVPVATDEPYALAAMEATKKPAASTPSKPATPAKPAATKSAAGKGKPETKDPPKQAMTKNKMGAEKTTEPPYEGNVQSGESSGKSKSTHIVGDPDIAYAFEILVGEMRYGMFTEIAGLSWKAEPVPVREGGNNWYGMNMRGPGKFEPLTMKRGWFACSGEFYDMLKDALTGSAPRNNAKRPDITIQVLNRKQATIGTYNLKNCMLVEYTGPSFNSMSSQVGFEQMRFAYDYYTYSAA